MPALLAFLTALICACGVSDGLSRFAPLPVSALIGFFVWVLIFYYLKKFLNDLRP